ncbi:hypothetical protein [Microvirga massiliensis]|uniref:hypothetical protein n=1 Tax=Microvirga massiliensis TaxID=1033741 RepID=UPI00062B40BB|nr:hypothetical protein [Microvirga massiliensis]
MYDASDPRASLSAAPKATPTPTAGFAGAEYARFYDEEPQEEGPEGRTWYVCGQNFIVAYTEAEPGATFSRDAQPDEYVVLIPDAETSIEISAGSETLTIPGNSLAFVPPGISTVKVPTGGRIVRLFTVRSEDLVSKCANAESYAVPRSNIPPFAPWPAPRDGYRIRAYSLDVPPQPGRFGRIFRCTTFMVNILDPQVGPRDITKLSPHHHDDFEQGSLALEGSFTHHLRWPWTTNMNHWREDEHAFCASPSVTVIPPPAIHTSRGMEAGVNQLVDIFCPPRIDFSEKPGWVLNADDYPMPR